MVDVLRRDRNALPRADANAVYLNPEGLSTQGEQQFLRQCFGIPWNAATYRWYLRRPFAGRVPDRIVVMNAGQVVAGCGLAYRWICAPGGVIHPVSIIVAAATLPAFRGCGHYMRVLMAARARSAEQGCTAVLAFVTAGNSTGRGLTRIGAVRIPSYYITSDGDHAAPGRGRLQVADVGRGSARALRAIGLRAPDYDVACLHYADADAWSSQLLERPNPVALLQLGSTSRAIVETVGGFDRLQWTDGAHWERAAVLATLAARAHRVGRRLFAYSSSPAIRDHALREGLRVQPGYLMLLAASARDVPTVYALATCRWHLSSGDRM